MAMTKALEAARKRAEDAAARLRELEAQKEKKNARELYAFAKHRRIETAREKILLGALAQNLMKTMPDFKRLFQTEMHRFFTRPADRELLGLPPLPDSPKQPTDGGY